ncbi:NUDIX domain-containing protein [bacterium]|jgi:8-oxo-dGTP pyrophosphatase MutT (NUDIX family)|nr:NUDIX domain-containing protein [bacterium]
MVIRNKLDLTVGACIIFEGKVLLLLHTKLNKWLFPGGHIEPNESPDKAIMREVKEETGLDLLLLQYSDIKINKGSDELEKLAIPFHANIHNVGDHNHYCLYYLAIVKNGSFLRNHESQDIKWLSKEDLIILDNVPNSIRQMANKAFDLLNE